MGAVAPGCRGTPTAALRLTAPSAVTANRRVRSIGSSRSCSVGIPRRQYSENRMTVDIREWQIDAVRGGIDRDRVGLGRPIPAELGERSGGLLEHGHDPGLG